MVEGHGYREAWWHRTNRHTFSSAFRLSLHCLVFLVSTITRGSDMLMLPVFLSAAC